MDDKVLERYVKRRQYNQEYYYKRDPEKLKQYRKKYRDKIKYKKYQKEWRKNNLERVKELQRKWIKNKAEYHREYQKRYREKDREKWNQIRKEWARKNPEKVKASRLRAYFKKYGRYPDPNYKPVKTVTPEMRKQQRREWYLKNRGKILDKMNFNYRAKKLKEFTDNVLNIPDDNIVNNYGRR